MKFVVGPRLLFIHGLGADLKNPLGIFSSSLPQEFSILAFDPRELGESDSSIGPCSIVDLADDAAGLTAAIGWDRYHIFEVSMGGMIVQELVLRHPQRRMKLILAFTAGGGKNISSFPVDQLDNLSTLEKLCLSDIR